MVENKSRPTQLFFCFGAPKSGTTLLQRALNLHPQVSCPSEQDYKALYQGFNSLFEQYNKVLIQADRRTGGQGADLVGEESIHTVFRECVITLVRVAAKGKPIMGANDNGIIANLDFFNDLFKQPRLIAIFRNPIDQGLSGWHHNQRLAREENDPRHIQLMTQFGGLDGWLRYVATVFTQNVARWNQFAAGRDNVHAVRYEDLVTRRKDEMRRIFSFLGADTEDATLDAIVAETDIERMRTTSLNPAFFRAGTTDMGAGEITQELRRELTSMTAEAMGKLGYIIN
jgi:hypothetical protein